MSVAVHAWDLLKEVTIIFITSAIVWLQVNSREGTQLHPSPENWIKDLLSMAPSIRTRPVPPQSPPSGSFRKLLILLIRGLLLLLLLSRFSRVQLCATPWTAAYQAPPSIGFARQEYWSGLTISRVTIYSLDVLLFLFGTSLLFYVQF